jgi:hypothetical protein
MKCKTWWEQLILDLAREYLPGAIMADCLAFDDAMKYGDLARARHYIERAEEKLSLLKDVDSLT